MKIIDFSAERAEPIERFASVGASSVRLGDGHGEAHVYCVRFEPGGKIGEHPTGFGQLFLVVEGAGWISSQDGVRVELVVGQGAYFARGTTGQSRTVAALATGAAVRCALPDVDVTALRYAGLVQDIGMIASTPAFREPSARRSEVEQERMRLHPYYTERLLSRTRSLAPIGALASLHHERLDGSGYYRGVSAAQLPLTGRILAAADVYATLTEAQLQDPSTTLATTAEELRKEVRAGRLDAEAVSAVLAAARHRVRRRRRTRIAGLTNREIEVLRLLSEGLVNHQMAASLGISTHTVDHHIQHIYDKIDVASRAEAVRFAMQHQILGHLGE